MSDGNTVIKTLEDEIHLAEYWNEDSRDIDVGLLKSILKLLKEQQQIPAVRNVQWHEVTQKRMINGICPACNSIITHFDGSMFCDRCGQAVKWE